MDTYNPRSAEMVSRGFPEFNLKSAVQKRTIEAHQRLHQREQQLLEAEALQEKVHF